MMHEPSVFIASDLGIWDLVPVLEDVLGVSFVRRPVDLDDELTFIHDGGQLGLHLYEHNLEDDLGIPFTEYRYSLDVAGGPTHEALDELTRGVFAKLKASGHFRLMLVDDLQVLHETFAPAAPPGS